MRCDGDVNTSSRTVLSGKLHTGLPLVSALAPWIVFVRSCPLPPADFRFYMQYIFSIHGDERRQANDMAAPPFVDRRPTDAKRVAYPRVFFWYTRTRKAISCRSSSSSAHTNNPKTTDDVVGKPTQIPGARESGGPPPPTPSPRAGYPPPPSVRATRPPAAGKRPAGAHGTGAASPPPAGWNGEPEAPGRPGRRYLRRCFGKTAAFSKAFDPCRRPRKEV